MDATAVAGGPAWHGIPFLYRSGTALIYRLTEQAVYPRSPAEIIERAFSTDRRVLLFVQPGIGKSTFARELAAALHEMGRSCCCIGADPGSPRFGLPGAACLGHWDGENWQMIGYEALCTLDAGRFRLPLSAAVRRLTDTVPLFPALCR